eukprot:COSAG01_NODE_4156_length_5291_cov_4.177196_2_plen_84_part_00
MKWIEGQRGTISYMPWTWNTWGAEGGAKPAGGGAAAADGGGSSSRGAGEALVVDYSGKPTQWGAAVKSSFEKATIGTHTAAVV